VTDLIEDFAHYRIVLTEGRFTAARGFTLSDDGVTATPAEISQDDVIDRGGVVELSLTIGSGLGIQDPRSAIRD
jgi:hypothetical protein